MKQARTGTQPAARPSLVEAAHAALKAAIRDGEFPPGFQGSEQELALRLGMSRTPVHEAVIRLQEEGLVRVLAKRGVVVCALSPQDMREVYDVIVAIEAMAAELLAARPAAERLAVACELASLNAAMTSALAAGDLVAWARCDEQFHHLLVARCGNGRIERIGQTIMDQSHRARMLTVRLRPPPARSVAEHDALVRAIRDGKQAGARSAARAHRLRARDEILPLLERFGMKHL
jgi:DNA-binding GntR family transcriptional regulator